MSSWSNAARRRCLTNDCLLQYPDMYLHACSDSGGWQVLTGGGCLAAFVEHCSSEEREAFLGGWLLHIRGSLPQVFGIAANPAVVGNLPASNPRQRPSKKAEMQTEVTSRPPERQRCALCQQRKRLWQWKKEDAEGDLGRHHFVSTLCPPFMSHPMLAWLCTPEVAYSSPTRNVSQCFISALHYFLILSLCCRSQKKLAQDVKSTSNNPITSKLFGGASAGSEPIGSHQKAGSGVSAFKVNDLSSL